MRPQRHRATTRHPAKTWWRVRLSASADQCPEVRCIYRLSTPAWPASSQKYKPTRTTSSVFLCSSLGNPPFHRFSRTAAVTRPHQHLCARVTAAAQTEWVPAEKPFSTITISSIESCWLRTLARTGDRVFGRIIDNLAHHLSISDEFNQISSSW